MVSGPRPQVALFHLTCGDAKRQREIAAWVAGLVPGAVVNAPQLAMDTTGRGHLVSLHASPSFRWTPLREGLALAVSRARASLGSDAGARADSRAPDEGALG